MLEPSRKPLNLLFKNLNSEVNIRLKNGLEYRGKMVDCDVQMNLVLEGAVAYKDGAPMANFGSVVVRGSSILYVSIGPSLT